MRKHLIAALLAIVMCMAALSGCTLVRGFEKDIQVVLVINGEYYDSYTVNAFNNAIVPVQEAPQGLKFYGWTTDPDWEEKGAENVVVTQNKGLIRYDDVKDYAGEKLSVTLYPVFGAIPRHDIAIAWYNKVATSGLDESVIESFTEKLNAYLVSQGMNPGEMDIVIRSYSGNVGPSCDAILNDGDIDIMIGWAAASNLEGTGGLKPGVHFFENNGNILINPDKARYAARLSNSDNCMLVYNWIITEYAGEGGATLDYKWDGTTPEPEPDPEPTPDPDEPTTPSGIQYTIGEEDDLTFKIGCYGKTDTSGITEDIKAQFEEGFKEALKACGATDEQLANVEVKYYCYNTTPNNVAALDKAIEEDGGVDILLGGRALSAKNAPYLNPLIKESSDDMTIGSITDRKVIRFNNKGLTLAIYNWILSTEGAALLATPTAA